MKRSQGLRRKRSTPLMILVGLMWCVGTVTASDDPDRFDYKVLATSRTSTMEKEMNQASALGFRLAAVMGGRRHWGVPRMCTTQANQGESPSNSLRILLIEYEQ